MTLVAALADSRIRRVVIAERAAAWGEYLDRTRELGSLRYEVVEPWAWQRLREKLRAVEARERAALPGSLSR